MRCAYRLVLLSGFYFFGGGWVFAVVLLCLAKVCVLVRTLQIANKRNLTSNGLGKQKHGAFWLMKQKKLQAQLDRGAQSHQDLLSPSLGWLFQCCSKKSPAAPGACPLLSATQLTAARSQQFCESPYLGLTFFGLTWTMCPSLNQLLWPGQWNVLTDRAVGMCHPQHQVLRKERLRLQRDIRTWFPEMGRTDTGQLKVHHSLKLSPEPPQPHQT